MTDPEPKVLPPRWMLPFWLEELPQPPKPTVRELLEWVRVKR